MSDVVKEVVNIFDREYSKQVILYGPPGTSKTYSATIIAAAILKIKKEGEDFNDVIDMSHDDAEKYLKGNNNYKLVQFHPSYSYEDFVRGISVKTNGAGGVYYKTESKIIEDFSKDVKKENPKVLVIDEINRAPLASVLGELIYGLEYRGQSVVSPYKLDDDKDKELVIPKDLYIIGTMNTADRSIGSMDYAVRRRFAFVAVPSEPSAINTSWVKDDENEDKTTGKLAENLYNALIGDDANGIFKKELKSDEEMDVNDIKIGHTYFLGKKEFGKDDEGNDITGDKIRQKNEDYLVYRIIYQIWPIYNEYIKDGLIDNSENQAANRFADCLYDSLTEYRDDGKTIRGWRIYNEEKLKAFIIDTLIPNSDNKKKFEELESKK